MAVILRLAGIAAALTGMIAGIAKGRSILYTVTEAAGSATNHYTFHFGEAALWWIGGLALGLGLYAQGILLDRLEELRR
ncbi:MAG: hypothetical protein K0Q90_808 [Paenibacillaceae bacterium]|nr:hypothetical protein [Paenibacillaceae bacterium]